MGAASNHEGWISHMSLFMVQTENYGASQGSVFDFINIQFQPDPVNEQSLYQDENGNMVQDSDYLTPDPTGVQNVGADSVQYAYEDSLPSSVSSFVNNVDTELDSVAYSDIWSNEYTVLTYPENSNYEFFELASTTSLPHSKAFEIIINESDDTTLDLKIGLHQYIYNIGDSKLKINWN